MLFLPLAEVQATTQQLFKAQPFLGALAADPSLRGILDSLSTALLGVSAGQAKLADLDAPMARFADSLRRRRQWPGAISFLAFADHRAPPPSRRNCAASSKCSRSWISTRWSRAESASDAIRADAARAGPDAGKWRAGAADRRVPLSDEEFATLTDRAWLMGGAMLGGVLLTLWLALRSFRMIFAILVTLVVGLAVTMALGLMAVGVFNIISIAFIALFVGLGVDFGIQFSVRYRSERFHQPDLRKALCHTGRSVGVPLALAALATAVGFFSFLPTQYTGVAELGFVAGVGMIAAFLLPHHPAAGAADAAEAARRERGCRLSPPGAAGRIS